MSYMAAAQHKIHLLCTCPTSLTLCFASGGAQPPSCKFTSALLPAGIPVQFVSSRSSALGSIPQQHPAAAFRSHSPEPGLSSRTSALPCAGDAGTKAMTEVGRCGAGMAGREPEGARGPEKSLPASVFPEVFLLRLGSLVALKAACSLPAF